MKGRTEKRVGHVGRTGRCTNVKNNAKSLPEQKV